MVTWRRADRPIARSAEHGTSARVTMSRADVAAVPFTVGSRRVGVAVSKSSIPVPAQFRFADVRPRKTKARRETDKTRAHRRRAKRGAREGVAGGRWVGRGAGQGLAAP